PRDAFDEDVTAREERHHQPFEEVILGDDHLLDLVQHLLHRLLVVLRELHPRPLRVAHCCGVGPPAAPVIGTAKPTPMKTSWLVGLARPVTMPITWPRRLSSGPPELPGLTAA